MSTCIRRNYGYIAWNENHGHVWVDYLNLKKKKFMSKYGLIDSKIGVSRILEDTACGDGDLF